MKIALCMFGQPRFIDRGFSCLKPLILDKYNPDVFIHTWNSRFMTESPFHYGEGWKDQRIAKEDTDRYLSLYQPKSYKVEAPRDFSDFARHFPKENTFKNGFGGGYESDEGWAKHINASICMWYSISESLKLAEDPYDYLVLARSDIGIGQFNVDSLGYGLNFESLNHDRLCNNWFNVIPGGLFKKSFESICDRLGEFYEDNDNVWCNELFIRYWASIQGAQLHPQSWGLSIPSFRM